MRIIPFDSPEIQGNGVLMDHVRAFQQVAHSTDTVIILRPVSPYAQTYLKEECATKPFCLKNKTVKDGGPFSGTVPENPLFGESKFTQAEFAQHKKELEAAQAEDDHLKFIPFSLSIERFKEIQKINEVENEAHPEAPKKILSYKPLVIATDLGEIKKDNPHNFDYELTWIKHGREMKVFGKKYGDGTSMHLYDSDNKPIQVISELKYVTEKVPGQPDKQSLRYRPVTADYDSFVFCPPMETLDPAGKDFSPLSTQSGLRPTKSGGTLNDSIEKMEQKFGLEPRKESEKGGNWTLRIQEMVELMNEAINPKNEEDERIKTGLKQEIATLKQKITAATGTDKDEMEMQLKSKEQEFNRLERIHEASNITHHNALNNNPHADELIKNFPALVILPREAILSQTLEEKHHVATPDDPPVFVVIESENDLKLVRNELIENGYSWPSHEKYKNVAPPFTKLKTETMEKYVQIQRAHNNGPSSSTNSMPDVVRQSHMKYQLNHDKLEYEKAHSAQVKDDNNNNKDHSFGS
ncbi:MAG: anthrax toxin-like adenylyl cyclase domain-containing protein [Legionella sp.]|jgi:hypothetical protein